MKNILATIIAVLTICVPSLASDNLELHQNNLVIVLDMSGSMGEVMKDASGNKVPRYIVAREAIQSAMSNVDPSTNVGLLVFGNRSGWAYQLGPFDSVKFDDALMGLKPNGGTPLGKYMKIGADQLLEQRNEQFNYGSYRLLVVTDGAARDQGKVDRFTPEIRGRGITLDAIGVDMATSHSLARLSNSYADAKDADQLETAIRTVVAEVSSGSSFDDSNNDVYDEIAGFDPDIASAIIRALASSGNHPIGTKPKAKQVINNSNNGPVQSQNQNANQNQPGFDPSLILLGVVIVVVIIVIIGGILGS